MNETLKTISTRYACRDYKSDIISDEYLMTIANAAIEAPSAMNLQKWRIIVVKNKELIGEMGEAAMNFLKSMEDKSIYERIMSRGGAIFYNAPCMIIVAVDNSEKQFAQMDCGIVCENIALAATSLGLGNVICGMAGIPFMTPKAEEFKKKLKFENGYDFGIGVLIGYAKTQGKPHEPDKSKIIVIE